MWDHRTTRKETTLKPSLFLDPEVFRQFLVDEDLGTITNFCQRTGLSNAQVSRVLHQRSGVSAMFLTAVYMEFGLGLDSGLYVLRGYEENPDNESEK